MLHSLQSSLVKLVNGNTIAPVKLIRNIHEMTIIRRDVGVLIILISLSFASLVMVSTRLQTNGDLASSLKSSSEEYARFVAHQEMFGDDTKDVVIAVESNTVLPLSDLEDLVIELQLTPGIIDVFSIFSLPSLDGSGQSFLKNTQDSELSVEQQLSILRETIPFASGLIDESGHVTLLLVILDPSIDQNEFGTVLERPFSSAADTLRLSRIGTPRLETEIEAALAYDQLTITPTAIVLSFFLIFLIFRSWRAMIVCGLPVVCALFLFFGGMAVTGTAMAPMLSLVPVIVIVLGFADSVHYFHAISRKSLEQDINSAVASARSEILPAIISTTLTTILAFMAMLTIDSAALRELAVVGSVGMILMLVVVAITVPVLARLLFTPATSLRATKTFCGLIRNLSGFLRHARLVATMSVLMIVGLFMAQTYVITGYDSLEYIPHNSTFLSDLTELENNLPGSGRYFVLIDAVEGGPDEMDANKIRLARASEAVLGVRFDLTEAPQIGGFSSRFVAADNSAFSLPVPTSMILTSDEIRSEVADMEALLADAGLDDVAKVTGYGILAAQQMPVLVDGLRTAFYIAIIAMTAITALVLRSLSVALIALVPNLFPILGVEAWMAMSGTTITITSGVALLVAFGIAVDNTIHLINRVRLERGNSFSPLEVVVRSLEALISPILTTGILLIVGFALTAFSALPAVGLFGALTAAAIILAIVADLFMFPSLMLVLLRNGLK